MEDGEYRWVVTAEAEAPNGRISQDTAISTSVERKKKGTKKGEPPLDYVPEHNVLTVATTRALNRAISDLLGGSVSAEEMR